MSDVLGRAIFARLAGDGALVALLDTYRSQPAIFTDPDVPKDAVLDEGWVTAGHQITNEPFDSKTTTGEQPARDLGCYTRRTHGSDRVYAMATRLHARLHRYRLTVTGKHTVVAIVGGPVVAPTDATLWGLVVPVRWTLGHD